MTRKNLAGRPENCSARSIAATLFALRDGTRSLAEIARDACESPALLAALRQAAQGHDKIAQGAAEVARQAAILRQSFASDAAAP